jgi:general secretion pathway protein A
MYEAHWNLTARPFENRYDAAFYYPSDLHQAAALKLRYAIENRRAAAILSSTSGMGKSLLIQHLQSQVEEWATPFIEVAYPIMQPDQLLSYIARQLTGTTDAAESSDARSAIESIQAQLKLNAEQNRQVVLVVDEAHVLEQIGLLEPLRMLLNLAVQVGQGESALTLVLCGQPTLLAHVQRNNPLDERIAVRCVLNRFGLDETMAYIGHRVRTAGGNAEDIFEIQALEHIHHLTQGVPRRINRLCDLALMVGFAEETSHISYDLIDNVQNELTTPSLVD